MKRDFSLTILPEGIKGIFPSFVRNPHNRKKFRNRVRKIFIGKAEYKFLFVLCPPYSGSTLIVEFLSTSENISSNNDYSFREGQTLPEVRSFMYDLDRMWDESIDYPWEDIKEIWLKYWDITKPILLEKSPSNIVRALEIEKVFQPVIFIIMTRNPYAFCEGYMRRHGCTELAAARFVVQCFQYQKRNCENLANNIFFTYEQFTDDPESVKTIISQEIPELNDLKYNMGFKAKNIKNEEMGIKNLNDLKINKLSPQQINNINSVFTDHKELFNYFGYDLILQ